MGRNTAEALCLECGRPFMWLIGNPQVCPACWNKEPASAKSDLAVAVKEEKEKRD